MLVIGVRSAELLDTIEQSVKEQGIVSAAIVTLIGAADSFTLSTMPTSDTTQDTITDYELPADMTATGEIVDASACRRGDGRRRCRAISGHLNRAQIGTCSPGRTWWLTADPAIP